MPDAQERLAAFRAALAPRNNTKLVVDRKGSSGKTRSLPIGELSWNSRLFFWTNGSASTSLLTRRWHRTWPPARGRAGRCANCWSWQAPRSASAFSTPRWVMRPPRARRRFAKRSRRCKVCGPMKCKSRRELRRRCWSVFRWPRSRARTSWCPRPGFRPSTEFREGPRGPPLLPAQRERLSRGAQRHPRSDRRPDQTGAGELPAQPDRCNVQRRRDAVIA